MLPQLLLCTIRPAVFYMDENKNNMDENKNRHLSINSSGGLLLPNQDSNPDRQNQNL